MTPNAMQAIAVGASAMLAAGGAIEACGVDYDFFAQQAVSEDAAVAVRARAFLRSMGPQGLDALLGRHADAIESGPRDPPWRCAQSDPKTNQLDSCHPNT